MREKILAGLKTKFDGVDTATLGRLADQLATKVTKEEDVQTVVDGVTFAQVLENYGDYRATGATKTAVANYEKKHGLKDGKKVETTVEDPKPKQTGGNEMSEREKKLFEMVEKLTKRMDDADKQNTTNSRKKQLEEAIAKLPDSLKKVYGRTVYDGMSDEDFTALMGEVKTEVEGFEKEATQKGTIFGKPFKHQGGGGNAFSAEQAKSIVDGLNI